MPTFRYNHARGKDGRARLPGYAFRHVRAQLYRLVPESDAEPGDHAELRCRSKRTRIETTDIDAPRMRVPGIGGRKLFEEETT